jgi:hypothetical protein
MSNNTNNNIPGLFLPTQKGMLAGNPRDSAIAEGNAANLKLQALRSIGGSRYRSRGRRMRKKRGGAASVIQVPQFNMLYSDQSGDGQDPNSIIQQNARIGTQGAANAVFDKYATQMGGQYNINMNTNTNQYQWGCYSGGKKYKKYRKGGSGSRFSKKKRTNRTNRTNRINKTNRTRKYRK